MSRIIVIVNDFKEKDEHYNKLINYAFNEDTLEAVILPSVHPSQIGAKFDRDIGEYILDK
ncbi:MAG: hypothetical protein ABFD15_06080 [Methanofastidiosum sp.]